MNSRRRWLGRLAGIAGAAGLAGCTRRLSGPPDRPDLGLPQNPRAGDLPARQHAWNDFLRRDAAGNRLPPRHHRIVLLDLDAEPSVESARTVERAMRAVEAAYDWAHDGVFHVLMWGPKYFDRVGKLDAAPVRRPEVLSRTDDPELQDFDAALLLSGDDRSALVAVEEALFGRRSGLDGEPLGTDLRGVFRRVGRRTGFIGEGLPADHADVDGIPAGAEISEGDRMFMGFFSGRRRTQASEDRVTIADGAYAGGTTAHLSHLDQSLGTWFDGLDEADRVARMFSAAFSPGDVAAFETDVPFDDDLARAVVERAGRFGVVGHHEKVAQVRRDDEPLILRRDFNTVDGGSAGVHFLSFQASLDDFVRTRDAMNGWWLRGEHPDITDRENNGILDFVTVVSRANFYVPPRRTRAFPGL